MKQIRAIGFDLFNTLMTVERHALDEAIINLLRSLERSGFRLEQETFIRAHQEAALRFIAETKQNGRETHNRFWVCAALAAMGYDVAPDDTRISVAVEDYFSAFMQCCHLIPGTGAMLESVKREYRLGLLSNFTHAPAVRKIIDQTGLAPFFDVVLISGELGYRKPYPLVFDRLVEGLKVERNLVLFVGDDIEADITGAARAGLQSVWMTYVMDHRIPAAPGPMARSEEKPDCDVTRISTWEDLHTLLNGRPSLRS